VGSFEREPSAADDRVSCIDFRQDELDEQLPTYSPEWSATAAKPD